jgi:hypothetical protein
MIRQSAATLAVAALSFSLLLLNGSGADACAARANGVPAREPNSQIQAMLTARRSGWRGGWLQTAARDAAVPHQQWSGGIQSP